MGLCEVIKTNVVFADEIFHLTDTRTVNPNLGTLRGPFTGTAKICVLDIKNFRCSTAPAKLMADITFAICEDLKTGDDKELEFFFRLEKTVIFQKPDCPGADVLALLKPQIKWVKGTNTITINDGLFTQKVDIDIKLILEEEKQLCVALCENTGELNIVNPDA